MNFIKSVVLVFSLILSLTANAASLKRSFTEAKFQGQIRGYSNVLDFQNSNDRYGTAFGGRLSFETSADQMFGFSGGVGYYTANDLGTNRPDVGSRAPFTPTVDIDILGEAFLRWRGLNTLATAGNQLIDTPFANPSDAFVIPVTYTGYSVLNKSIDGWTFSGHHLNFIKARESQEFIDVGTFVTSRFGAAPARTGGTSILGAVYKKERSDLQAWHYTLPDIFTIEYLQAEHELDLQVPYAPYASLQFGFQKESGSAHLGHNEATLSGARVGAKAYGANVSLSANVVSRNRFVMPYTYSSDPSFTNSMLSGLGSYRPGNAWKLQATYDFSDKTWARVSHALLAFDDSTDTVETDVDLRHKFKDDLENLSVMLRFGRRTGKTPPASLPDLTEYRTQIQYVF